MRNSDVTKAVFWAIKRDNETCHKHSNKYPLYFKMETLSNKTPTEFQVFTKPYPTPSAPSPTHPPTHKTTEKTDTKNKLHWICFYLAVSICVLSQVNFSKSCVDLHMVSLSINCCITGAFIYPYFELPKKHLNHLEC